MNSLNRNLEILLPWWANNLLRWVVNVVLFPLTVLFLVVELLYCLRAVFSGGSTILMFPWESNLWDIVLGDRE